MIPKKKVKKTPAKKVAPKKSVKGVSKLRKEDSVLWDKDDFQHDDKEFMALANKLKKLMVKKKQL